MGTSLRYSSLEGGSTKNSEIKSNLTYDGISTNGCMLMLNYGRIIKITKFKLTVISMGTLLRYSLFEDGYTENSEIKSNLDYDGISTNGCMFVI